MGKVEMLHVEQSIMIHRPVEEIWAFVTDFQNLPKLTLSVIEIRKMSPGPIGIGSTVEVLSRGLGRNWVESSHVIEFDPINYIITLLWTGSYGKARVHYVLEPVLKRTKFSASADWELCFPYSLFLFFGLARYIRRVVTASLENVKRILET